MVWHGWQEREALWDAINEAHERIFDLETGRRATEDFRARERRAQWRPQIYPRSKAAPKSPRPSPPKTMSEGQRKLLAFNAAYRRRRAEEDAARALLGE